LLFVVQLSAAMNGPLPGGPTKLGAALQLVGDLLALLRQDAGWGQAPWDVGVFGVRGGAAPESLLAGADPFVPLTRPAPLTDARADGPGCTGALADAGRLLHAWAARHPHTLAPVVVYCTDESAGGNGLLLHSRSLRLLRGDGGPPAVVVCGFSGDPAAATPFPAPGPAGDSAVWRTLWKGCTTVRGSADVLHRQGRCGAGRAFCVNDSPAPALARLVQARAGAPPGLPGDWSADAPAPCDVRVLWAPKDGNTDDEWEDGFAFDAGGGVAAVADGASQSIFARRWAETLTRRFVAGRPDLTDPAAAASWLAGCRSEWMRGVGYNDLHGLHQDKVDRTGGHATFLSLEVRRGPAGLRWRASCVGDACLLWVRGGKLAAAFPLVRSHDFGIAPDLVPTLARLAGQVRFMTAESSGKLGDWYGLATDATAQFLLRCYEQGQGLDWRRYWDMGQDEWRRRLGQLRQRRHVTNDDATWVMLRPRP
jgi:hypothetical protein